MNRIVRRLLALAALALADTTHAAIPAAERQVLLDLYAQTNGAGWTNSAGWNGAAGTECGWAGIVCDGAESHVTGISMQNNHLSGALPSLAPLAGLVDLNLGDNQLTGSIAFLASLTNLQSVVLWNNQLSGNIPALSGLTNLAFCYLRDNQFSGGIPALSGLTNLVNFQVSDNQLTGPLPSLSGLTSLAVFYASNNQLTGPIPSLSGLNNLYQFDVDYNRLTGPIPPLSGLANLNRVTLYHNQLTGAAPPVPSPNNLAAGQSRLCPNALEPANDPPSANDQAWNAATGTTPWSQQCGAPVLSLSPDPLDFGDLPLDGLATRSITLTNGGAQDAVDLQLSIAPHGDFVFESGSTCEGGGTLAAGQSCTLLITAIAGSSVAVKQATLQAGANAASPASATLTVNVIAPASPATASAPMLDRRGTIALLLGFSLAALFALRMRPRGE